MKTTKQTVFNSNQVTAVLETVSYNPQSVIHGLVYSYQWQSNFDMKVVQQAEIQYGARETATAVYFEDKAQADKFVNEWLLPYLKSL